MLFIVAISVVCCRKYNKRTDEYYSGGNYMMWNKRSYRSKWFPLLFCNCFLETLAGQRLSIYCSVSETIFVYRNRTIIIILIFSEFGGKRISTSFAISIPCTVCDIISCSWEILSCIQRAKLPNMNMNPLWAILSTK